MYKGNLKLAQAFHPLLSTVEVVVRNAFYDAIEVHFGDPDWIINEKTGFMSSPALARGRYFLRTQVIRTEADLLGRRIPISSPKIVAEQTFKFWTDLVARHHMAVLSNCPMNAFPNIPATKTVTDVYQHLKEIRKFRNRINHCEPIFLYGATISFSLVTQTHQQITDILKWINPDLLKWIKDIDRVPANIARCRRI